MERQPRGKPNFQKLLKAASGTPNRGDVVDEMFPDDERNDYDYDHDAFEELNNPDPDVSTGRGHQVNSRGNPGRDKLRLLDKPRRKKQEEERHEWEVAVPETRPSNDRGSHRAGGQSPRLGTPSPTNHARRLARDANGNQMRHRTPNCARSPSASGTRSPKRHPHISVASPSSRTPSARSPPRSVPGNYGNYNPKTRRGSGSTPVASSAPPSGKNFNFAGHSTSLARTAGTAGPSRAQKKEMVFLRKAAYLVCDGFLDPASVADMLGRSVSEVEKAVLGYRTHGEDFLTDHSPMTHLDTDFDDDEALGAGKRNGPVHDISDVWPDHWPDLPPIQTIARIRPLNNKEKQEESGVCVSAPGKTEIMFKLNERELRKQAVHADFKRGRMKEFLSFPLHRAFDIESRQEQVYLAGGRPLLAKVMQGFNGCFLAYGQTGSGKTFTMEGTLAEWTKPESEEDAAQMKRTKKLPVINRPKTSKPSKVEENPGVIPRLLTDLFEGIKVLEGKMDIKVTITYIEIYMEIVIDLLAEFGENQGRPPDVVEDKVPGGKGVFVQNVVEREVRSLQEALELVRSGQEVRQVAETEMNTNSSRSHAVLTLYFTTSRCGDTSGTTRRRSKLHLVDLAGSERLKDTQATGERMKEGNSINKSLSALAACLQAMTQSKKIPRWRESKITRLLQDSLGGNAYAVILAALSPALESEDESLSTIRFTMMAQKIKAQPKQNLDPITIIKTENRELKQRVAILERLLSEAGIEAPPRSAPIGGRRSRSMDPGGRKGPKGGAAKRSPSSGSPNKGSVDSGGRPPTHAGSGLKAGMTKIKNGKR